MNFITIWTVFRTAGVTGNIMVNSKARNLNEFRRLSAYIMQNDNLQPLLTVQEAMNIAAELKLIVPSQQKKQKVHSIRHSTHPNLTVLL